MTASGTPFYTADVFTSAMFGGNQLAVFPDASKIPPRLMQPIARELNLSETVFVLPPEDARHTRKIRIFTPGTELPFAGHPTVGTAFVLASIGEITLHGSETRIVFEEGVGPVAVSIRSDRGQPTYCELTSAKIPELGPAPPAVEEVAAVLSLRPEEIRTNGLAPRGASCGVPYFFVPLRDLDSLGRARPDLSVWERSFAHTFAPNLYPFVETAGAERRRHSRPDVRALDGNSGGSRDRIRRRRAGGLPGGSPSATHGDRALGGGSGRRDGPAQPDAPRVRPRRRPGDGGPSGGCVGDGGGGATCHGLTRCA